MLGNEESRKKYDILYEKVFIQNREITIEDKVRYKEWQYKGYKKQRNIERKTMAIFLLL